MDWTQTFVNPENSLRDVIATIDKAELQIALVVDAEFRLLGLITDGDVWFVSPIISQQFIY